MDKRNRETVGERVDKTVKSVEKKIEKGKDIFCSSLPLLPCLPESFRVENLFGCERSPLMFRTVRKAFCRNSKSIRIPCAE